MILPRSRPRKTAQEIGAALATAGMGLVVYFSDDASLEPHLVSGYVAALPPGVGAKSIRVRFAESQKNQVKFAEQTTRGELFDPILGCSRFETCQPGLLDGVDASRRQGASCKSIRKVA